ncbi:MAG: aminomethyl-transferring glycine dehydrogenase subunit GcvPB, partial [Thermodesulfobacteriota bacterium]
MKEEKLGLLLEEPLIFDKSSPGRRGVEPVENDVPEADPAARIPAGLLRDDIPGFPEVSEIDTVRHYTRLSQWN